MFKFCLTDHLGLEKHGGLPAGRTRPILELGGIATEDGSEGIM
eukprot:SAG31_NODE_34656_length_330_cov_6.173160_1_plen_42_part_10